jgi:hypothetical protein
MYKRGSNLFFRWKKRLEQIKDCNESSIVVPSDGFQKIELNFRSGTGEHHHALTSLIAAQQRLLANFTATI